MAKGAFLGADARGEMQLSVVSLSQFATEWN